MDRINSVTKHTTLRMSLGTAAFLAIFAASAFFGNAMSDIENNRHDIDKHDDKFWEVQRSIDKSLAEIMYMREHLNKDKIVDRGDVLEAIEKRN